MPGRHYPGWLSLSLSEALLQGLMGVQRVHTWGDSGGDGRRGDGAAARSGERCHLDGVRRGGGEAGQLVLQGGVGQQTLLTGGLHAGHLPPQLVACRTDGESTKGHGLLSQKPRFQRK